MEGFLPVGGWEANGERIIESWGVKKTMLYLKKALSQISHGNPRVKVPSLGAAFAFFPVGIKFRSFRGTVNSTQLL